MNTSNYSYPVLFSIFLLFSLSGCSQNNRTSPSTSDTLMTEARYIISSAKSCALITLDKEGIPRARTMDPFAPEKDFTVWFGTNPKSRKVTQIKNDPRVTLYYLADDNSGYVTIYGTAQIVNDSIEKERRWKNEWESFYTDKASNYTLIKVDPIWMEVISETANILGDEESWQPPRIEFD